MKKTYCAPDFSIQYVSLHSAIMSDPTAQGEGGAGNDSQLNEAPGRTLYI